MFKPIIHHLKFYLTSIFIIGSLFLLFVYLQNKNIMTIHMQSSTIKQMKPQVYFTSTGQPFLEEKSKKPFNIQNNQYHFELNNLNDIHLIRFDPARKKTDIILDSVLITKSRWFTKSILMLPLKNLTPAHQIENYTNEIKRISFSTIGTDPQLNALFTLSQVSTSQTIHLPLLLLSIFIFIALLYLYKLFRTETLDDFLTAKLILYFFFISLAVFKVDYYKDNVRFAHPPDELAHLSYIKHIQTNDTLIPKFEEMKMLNNKKAGNYLNHPPLYYHLMNIVHDDNYSILQNVDNFRTLSAFIFIASFLLLIYLGFNINMGLVSHLVFLSVITSIPMFSYLGASISNDNLAILGALIFIVGLKRIFENNYTTFTYFLLGLGAFIAYFSKLTAAILIFFTVLYFMVYTIKEKKWIQINILQITILVLFAIPILYYQFHILSTYHSLMPSFHITNPEEFLKSSFFIPEEHRQHLSQIEWLERMKKYISGGWFGIHSHNSFTKSHVLEYVGLLLLHITALLALSIKCNDKNNSYCLIGKIGLLSLFSVLIVQFIFSYQTHVNNGYMGGLQPRYLLPFMFSFAIMASIFVERYKAVFIFNIFIILISIHAVYSDFFYFLKYYS